MTNLEGFLKVVVLLEKHGVVDDDLRCGDTQVNDLVIHSFT